MNDIPLIQKADINSINTSIIAIKKQLKQLNEALGLVDVPSIDTSVFVKKSDVVDVVEADNMNPVTSNAVVPVDEVTSGNMHSVTSNAVAENLKLNDIKTTTISNSSATPTIIDKSGFLIVIGKISGNSPCTLSVNTKTVCTATIHNGYSNVPFSFIFPVSKGDSVYLTYNVSFVTIDNTFIREFNFN
jgi:hypothetical protein